MLIALLILIVLVGSYYFADLSGLKKNVAKSGGMHIKYAELCKLLLANDSRAKIYKETPVSLILGLEVVGGYTKFELLQGFNQIIVKMTISSNVFGDRKMEWKFDDTMNQLKMYDLICVDIAKMNEQLP